MEVCVSKGYVFQMEMLVRANRFGYKVGQVRSFDDIFQTKTSTAMVELEVMCVVNAGTKMNSFPTGSNYFCG